MSLKRTENENWQQKKLSNNTIIEIDNCSPLEILKLQKNLLQIAEQEHITFVCGKGERKTEIQQLYEELEACGERLMGYKECFRDHGDRPEQLFQNRFRSYLYENERRPYAKWAIKSSI